MKKQQKLNAYLISYILNEQVRNIVVVAYFDKGAMQKVKYHFNVNLNKEIKIISCQRLNKTKKNAKFYTNEFYQQQESLINYKGKKEQLK